MPHYSKIEGLNPGAGTGREEMEKPLMPMASGSSTVVEHLTHNPKTEGSTPAARNGRNTTIEKMEKVSIC